MAMSIHKYLITIIIIAAGLLIGGFGSAAWGLQEQKNPAPVPEDEKQRLLESLKQKLQQTETAANPFQPAPKQQKPQPAAPPAAAPQPSGSVEPNSGKIRMNMENADLYDFVNQIATTLEITPIVIDPEVKGTVTILSSTPMSEEDIFLLFILILKNNNASLIKEDGVYQIIPVSSALKRGIQIIEKLPEPASGKALPKLPAAVGPAAGMNAPGTHLDLFKSLAARRKPDAKAPSAASAKTPEPEESPAPELATHVIRAEFIPVKDLIEPVKLFMTEGGVIMPYERLNMLILTDYTDSAARILQIIRMLDNSYLDPDLVELIKIENNASAAVAEDLTKIFGSGKAESATGISFISIDRINAIFVIASSKRGLEEVKQWIKQLDAVSGRNIQTYVYVVQNSTASNIAMMISVLYGGEDTAGAAQAAGSQAEGGTAIGGDRNMQTGLRSAFTNQSRTGAAASPFGGQSSQYGGGGYGGFGESGVFSTGQRLGPRLNVQPTVSSQILRGGEFSGLQDTVRMVVDGINNRLIIQATAADYAYISDTIKKMDVLPRQVIIDARVFEIDLNKSLSFGVNAALQGRGASGEPADHITGAGLNISDTDDIIGLSANTFAFVGDSREILMRINALRLKTNVRILQAPSVLALDGQPASILVGSEIPYAGGSYTSSAGGSTTSVQYRETGVSLLVLPRISASGSVTLNITQEVSSPGSSIQIGNSETPSFSVSKVETTLSVKDGETVAIAGIIQDSDNFDRVGIPFLSDIPILGYLFGQTSKQKHRMELIILITPHVIRTVEGFQRMSQELKDSLRNVRRYADEKEREHRRDMEEAREDRYKQEQKAVKEME
jgi:general secretion pathway protein D